MTTTREVCLAFAEFTQTQREERFFALLSENVRYLSKWFQFETAAGLRQWLMDKVSSAEEHGIFEYHVGIHVSGTGTEQDCVFSTSRETGRVEGITFFDVEAGQVVGMRQWHCPTYYPPFHRDGDRIWEGEWRAGALRQSEYDAMPPDRQILVDVLGVAVTARAEPPPRTH